MIKLFENARRFADRFSKLFTVRLEQKKEPVSDQQKELAQQIRVIDDQISTSPSIVKEWTPIASPQNPTKYNVVVGFTPLQMPDQVQTVPESGKSIESGSPTLEEIQELIQTTSRVKSVDQFGNEVTQSTELIIVNQGATDEFKLESIESPKNDLIGIRATEGGKELSQCADALSFLNFEVISKIGKKKNVRLSFVADGVGSSIMGDVAARILVNKSQEFCINAIRDKRLVSEEQIAEILPQAVAYADGYLHSIQQSTLKEILDQRLENLPSIVQQALSASFNDQRSIASSTLLGLAVIDEPSNTEPLKIIYLDGGDGGFDVSAGYNYENFHSNTAYKPGEAPEQINYGTSGKDTSYYEKLISQYEFNREQGTRFTITLRTDGFDKLQVLGKERSPKDMLAIALELSNAKNPTKILSQLASRVPDDVTYLIMKS